MATEIKTLWDIRAAAKSYEGIQMGNLVVTPENPLLTEPFQEMADDIARWLNPSQGWHVAEIRWGLINCKRIEQSIAPESTAKLIAKVDEPDQFTPVFHFDAENPPMTHRLFARKHTPIGKKLDFPRVFSPEFRDRVDISENNSADVHPEKIGSVYPLKSALEELSSPYYLVGTTVSVNRRNNGTFLSNLSDKQTKFEPATSLAVMIFMRDLPDYTRLEVNKLRRVQRQLDKKLI